MERFDHRSQVRSIANASPRAARWAWIINGVLFAVGGSASSFVYFSNDVSKQIVLVGRTGNVWAESLDSHLFLFPFFQLVLFLIPLMMDLNWPRFRSAVQHSVDLQRGLDSRYEQLDMVLVYFGVCFLLEVAGVVVFLMALFTASLGWARS